MHALLQCNGKQLKSKNNFDVSGYNSQRLMSHCVEQFLFRAILRQGEGGAKFYTCKTKTKTQQ